MIIAWQFMIIKALKLYTTLENNKVCCIDEQLSLDHGGGGWWIVWHPFLRKHHHCRQKTRYHICGL
jgi:hypothetical protein